MIKCKNAKITYLSIYIQKNVGNLSPKNKKNSLFLHFSCIFPKKAVILHLQSVLRQFGVPKGTKPMAVPHGESGDRCCFNLAVAKQKPNSVQPSRRTRSNFAPAKWRTCIYILLFGCCLPACAPPVRVCTTSARRALLSSPPTPSAPQDRPLIH